MDENFIKKFEDDEKSFRAKSLANKRQHLKSVKKLQKELALRHELANQKVVDLQRKVPTYPLPTAHATAKPA